VAQPQPLENRASSISGKMTPPTEPPVHAIPVAYPRLVMKKCPMAVVAGVTTSDVPTPPRMPNTMRKCQYSSLHSEQVVQCGLSRDDRVCVPVHIPMSMILAIISTLPTSTRSRGPLESNIGPMKMPHKNVRKMYVLKIHPIELVLYCDSWCVDR
jgi:hypothetical protein